MPLSRVLANSISRLRDQMRDREILRLYLSTEHAQSRPVGHYHA